MAQELQIPNNGATVKVRSPWAVALLPFITLGIYLFVWWYRVNRELRDYGRAKGYDLGQNPGNSLLALIPGFILLGIPPLVSYWRGTKRVQGAAKVAGVSPLSGWVALILYLVISPAFFAYLQVSLNEVWRKEWGLSPGQLPSAQASQMPPRLDEPATPAEQG